MRPRPSIGAATVRGDIRRLLSPLPVPSIDDHLDRGVAGEVVLKVARQLRVAARDDEEEAIRRARQVRGGAPTGLFARRGIGEQYRTRPASRRTYSESDRA